MNMLTQQLSQPRTRGLESQPPTYVRYCCPQQQKGAPLVMCLFSGGTTYLVQEEEKNNRGKQQLINVDIPKSLPLPSSV